MPNQFRLISQSITNNKIIIVHRYKKCDYVFIKLKQYLQGNNNITFYGIKSTDKEYVSIITGNNETIFNYVDKIDLHKWNRFLKENRINLGSNKMKPIYCMNTPANMNGMVIDSEGFICDISNINKYGCCSNDILYDYVNVCDSNNCDTIYPCCNGYEYCVGCCLNKQHNFKMEISYHKISNNNITGFEMFNKCKQVCRVSSKSLFQGNNYVQYRDKYCYNNTENVLNGILLENNFKIILGDKGKSCMETCVNVDMICNKDNQNIINECYVLKSKYKCNECTFTNDIYYPGINNHRNKCILKSLTQNDISCIAKNPEISRLCLCSKKEGN